MKYWFHFSNVEQLAISWNPTLKIIDWIWSEHKYFWTESSFSRLPPRSPRWSTRWPFCAMRLQLWTPPMYCSSWPHLSIRPMSELREFSMGFSGGCDWVQWVWKGFAVSLERFMEEYMMFRFCFHVDTWCKVIVGQWGFIILMSWISIWCFPVSDSFCL